MTGNTRDYLADLLNQKGIVLPGGQEMSQAQASAQIDELKEMPDAKFPELDVENNRKIGAAIEKIKQEMYKWTFGE